MTTIENWTKTAHIIEKYIVARHPLAKVQFDKERENYPGLRSLGPVVLPEALLKPIIRQYEPSLLVRQIDNFVCILEFSLINFLEGQRCHQLSTQ